MNISGLITAIRTLTIFPVLGRDADDFAAALPWFPVVGVGLGALAAILAWCLHAMPFVNITGDASAFAVLVFCIWANRAMHLDGIADCADGFWGGHTRERVLLIMKDSNVGSFGAIAIALVLLGKWIALRQMTTVDLGRSLIVAFAISRFVQVDLAVWLPYARAEGGTGRYFVANANATHRLAAFAITLAVAIAILGIIRGFATVLGFFVLGRILGGWFKKRVGGITGDLLGTANEITETIVLLCLAARPF